MYRKWAFSQLFWKILTTFSLFLNFSSSLVSNDLIYCQLDSRELHQFHTDDYHTTYYLRSISQLFDVSVKNCKELTVQNAHKVTPSGSVTEGTVVTVTCSKRYALIGSKLVTCLSSGTWSSTPRCLKFSKEFFSRVWFFFEICGGTSKVNPAKQSNKNFARHLKIKHDSTRHNTTQRKILNKIAGSLFIAWWTDN